MARAFQVIDLRTDVIGASIEVHEQRIHGTDEMLTALRNSGLKIAHAQAVDEDGYEMMTLRHS